ncbi:MAG: transporter substrate-binding domain-containing protein [Pseudomonadota bacterium]
MRNQQYLFAILCLLVGPSLHAECGNTPRDKVLKADARPRPPEMLVNEKTGESSGPLLDVLNEAVRTIGYCVEWRIAPFPRSLAELEMGTVDLVPRLVMTDERKRFANFLGPIAVKQTAIEFLVKRGKEDTLKSYEDLRGLTVGAKRGTAYFESFNKDTAIKRFEALDDENLAKMFDARRVDVLIVLDRPAIEQVLRELNISGYAWAVYKEPVQLGIYYGMSKTSRHTAITEPLSNALKALAKSGRVNEIYTAHHVPPPDREAAPKAEIRAR